MGKLVLFCVVGFSAISLFNRPFIAAGFYEFLSTLQAQALWPWLFDSLPFFRILAVISILGWIFALLRGAIDSSIYKNKQNYLILGLFLLVFLSDVFSPYPEYFAGTRADLVISTFMTIVIMYFVSLGLIKKQSDLKWILSLIIFGVVYYIYWCNIAYFESDWSRFFQGRLVGPENSQYSDGNVLSVFLIMGMPFLLLAGNYFKSKIIRVSFILLLFLLWHALFLLSSRGAFLSLLCVTILGVRYLEQAYIKKGIVALLLLAVVYQGGQLLSRGEVIVDRAQDSGSDESMNPRLVSWGVGLDIMFHYPILGAGSQRFQMAASELYPGKTPHVAHNTLISLAANCGIFSAMVFIMLLVGVLKNFRLQIKNGIQDHRFHSYLHHSLSLGIVGYSICSVFLDLVIFEAFYLYLMLILANSHMYQCQQRTGRLDEALTTK